jgi:UDP-glucose:(heptosyl)LPS alpha-1,3-glucosyltransferase
MKKLKIALIIDQFDSRAGGAERYTGNLAAGLAREGHEVHVFCRRGGPSLDGIAVHVVPTIKYPKYLRLLTFVRGVRKQVRREDFDIIHGLVHNPGVTVLNSHTGIEQSWFAGDDRSRESRAGLLWGRIMRSCSPRRHLILSLQRRQYRDPGVRAIISHSDKIKNDIVRYHGVDPGRIEVIYNGLDIKRFNPGNRAGYREATRKRLGLADDEIMILTVTNNYRLKGIFPAIRMLPALSKRVDKPFRLVIAGRDDARPYQKEAERLGVADRVEFLSFVEDIAPLYAAADIFMLLTFYDTCANVNVEAIVSGLPVVTTKDAGSDVFVASREMGWVVDNPRDREAVAEALSFYFRKEAREKAYALAEKTYTRYTSANNIRKILEVYRRVIS